MRVMKKKLLLLLLSTCLVKSDDIDIEKLVDADLDRHEQSLLLEYLHSLIETPLNVNKVSAKQLCTLPWLSPTLAVRLVDYRYRNGAFKDINDIPEETLHCDMCRKKIIDYTGHNDSEYTYVGEEHLDRDLEGVIRQVRDELNLNDEDDSFDE